jgi:hypothetical protein
VIAGDAADASRFDDVPSLTIDDAELARLIAFDRRQHASGGAFAPADDSERALLRVDSPVGYWRGRYAAW